MKQLSRESIICLYKDPLDGFKYVFNTSVGLTPGSIGNSKYDIIKHICDMFNIENEIFFEKTCIEYCNITILGHYPQYPNYDNKDQGALTELKKQFCKQYDAIWRCDDRMNKERELELGNIITNHIINQFNDNFDKVLSQLIDTLSKHLNIVDIDMYNRVYKENKDLRYIVGNVLNNMGLGNNVDEVLEDASMRYILFNQTYAANRSNTRYETKINELENDKKRLEEQLSQYKLTNNLMKYSEEFINIVDKIKEEINKQ